MMEVSEKVFVVTGGCSGLGAATAHQLARCGAHVIIVDVQRPLSVEENHQVGCQYFCADICDETAIAELMQTVKREYGMLNGVVNCAGVPLARKVLGKEGPHSLTDFVRVVQVNLVGAFNVIRLAAELMLQSPIQSTGERGVIVNTSSIAAFDGQIGQAAYAASKGGIIGMMLPLARELGRHGIRVVTVAPGIFHTPMMATVSDMVRHSLEQQMVFPVRMGEPSEYAQLVQHIVENVMINGEVIRLDGGIRLGV